MTVTVEVQYALQDEPGDADSGELDELPRPEDFQRWAAAACAGRCAGGEIGLRVVGLAEGAALNETYRHRRGPTNVLSFPIEDAPPLDVPPLGDLVICAPVVWREAREQHKSPLAHWAHLTVHGSLHLLGYDHEEADQAEAMERCEREILSSLGFPDPYADEAALRDAS
jgi:probable rRNA maturation factor